MVVLSSSIWANVDSWVVGGGLSGFDLPAVGAVLNLLFSSQIMNLPGHIISELTIVLFPLA